MSTERSWVACIEAAESEALVTLRLRPGLDVAPLGDVVWLRVPIGEEELERSLRQVPGLRRFELQSDGQLIPEGRRVPEGRLPALRWQALRDWLPLALPQSRGSGAVANRVPVRLVRSSVELAAGALLTDIRAWLMWVEDAPEIRLQRLRFAAAQDGRVWVEGTPLPALAGSRFHLREGVAIPCGLKCMPEVGAPVLRRWLGLAEGDTALAHPDGTWEVLRAELFVPAKRSAARLTAEALGHE